MYDNVTLVRGEVGPSRILVKIEVGKKSIRDTDSFGVSIRLYVNFNI